MYRIPIGEQFQKMQSTRVYIQSLIDSTTLQWSKPSTTTLFENRCTLYIFKWLCWHYSIIYCAY